MKTLPDSLTTKTFFSPISLPYSDGGYFSEDVLDWSTVITDVGRPVYISCPTDLSSRRKYHLQAVARDQPVVSQSHLSRKFFVIALKPSLVLHNLLPMAIQISGRVCKPSPSPGPSPSLALALALALSTSLLPMAIQILCKSSTGPSPGPIH